MPVSSISYTEKNINTGKTPRLGYSILGGGMAVFGLHGLALPQLTLTGTIFDASGQVLCLCVSWKGLGHGASVPNASTLQFRHRPLVLQATYPEYVSTAWENVVRYFSDNLHAETRRWPARRKTWIWHLPCFYGTTLAQWFWYPLRYNHNQELNVGIESGA